MKRNNEFYYFLSFITFYTILLLWYTGYITNYEEVILSPASTTIGEHIYVSFIFKVVFAFPFGIINWFNDDPLNIVFYFLGAVFFSYLFYKVYYKKLPQLLWIMVLLNIMAAIFLLSFYAENPLILQEQGLFKRQFLKTALTA
jgi:hypothetical protein